MPRGKKSKRSKNASSSSSAGSSEQPRVSSSTGVDSVVSPELSQPSKDQGRSTLESEMSPEGSQPITFSSSSNVTGSKNNTPSKSNTPKKSPARTELQTQGADDDQMVPDSEEDAESRNKRPRPSSFKQFFESDEEAEESPGEDPQYTPKKKKTSYISTPSSYRIPSREGDETSERIVTPPSDRKRAKNFTEDEDRRIFRLVSDVYDGQIPPVVDKEVFTMLSNILKDRQGQGSGISRRFYRTAKFEFAPKDIEDHEAEDNAYFRPYQEFIFTLKEKIAKEMEEAESKKRTKQLGELERIEEQPEQDPEEQPEPPKSTPKKTETPKKSSTPNASSTAASREANPPDEETTKAQKLVTDLKSLSSKPTEYVTHALYACSGSAKLAARLLDDNIVLTEDDKRNIWTQKEDNILVMKIGGKELQTLVEYKGRYLVEARIAWLEVQDYEH